jgi:hypothetical protein
VKEEQFQVIEPVFSAVGIRTINERQMYSSGSVDDIFEDCGTYLVRAPFQHLHRFNC